MSALTKDATQVAKDVNNVNKEDVNKDIQPTQPQRGKAAVEHAARLARDAEQNALERQHAKGKSTARERLDLLFDTGTFEEIGRFNGGDINNDVAGCAVITGFGEVYGKKSGRVCAGFFRSWRHAWQRGRPENLPSSRHGVAACSSSCCANRLGRRSHSRRR